MADATLSIQLPYILLAATSVYKPHEDPLSKKLLRALRTVAQFAPHIDIETWVEGPVPFIVLTMDELKATKSAEDRWAAREKKTSEWIDAERKKWERLERSGKWILRRDTRSSEEVARDVGRWKEGDGRLTDREERVLGKGVWAFPFVLQRFGVAGRVRRAVLQELGGILAALEKTYDGVDNGLLRIVCNERCQMRVGLSPGVGMSWDLKTIRRTVLAMAGWEREFTAIDTMAGILEYSYLSRFLEFCGIRDLGKERRDAWRGLPNKKYADGVKGWVIGNAEWQYGIDVDERTSLEDTAVELWKFVDSIVGKSRTAVKDLAKSMERYETRCGRRLAVSFPLADDSGRESSSISSTTYGKQPLLLNEADPKVEAIVFQSHRSTLYSVELFAYMDFVTSLLDQIAESPYLPLRSKIESFRINATAHEDSPRASVVKLLSWLDVAQSTKSHYRDYLPEGNVWGDTGPRLEYEKAIIRATKPFVTIIKVIDQKRRKEREYVPVFLERYELAGGFNRTRKTKLLKLMENVDHQRETDKDREGQERYDGGKLKKLQPLALGEVGEPWVKKRQEVDENNVTFDGVNKQPGKQVE